MSAASTTECLQLSAFFDSVRSVLEDIVNARNILIREKLRTPLVTAWKDVRLAIEGAQGELSLGNHVLKDALGVAGLSGAQLSFKLLGFNEALSRYNARGTLGLLEKVLKWINTILQSLISALPGAEAIKEFKDSVEAEIADENPII